MFSQFFEQTLILKELERKEEQSPSPGLGVGGTWGGPDGGRGAWLADPPPPAG